MNMNPVSTACVPLQSLQLPGSQLVRIYLREAGHELLRLLRAPEFALPTLAFPLVFYVLFALLIPGQWSGYQKSAYMLATYGVFGVIGPALFGFGVGLALERQNGWLALKQIAPMPAGAYLAARIATSLVFALAVVLLLSAAAFGFGGVELPFLRWLLLVGVLLLGTLPFCAMGLMIGAWSKGTAAVAVVNLVFLPMSVLSGLWIPLMVFPRLMQELAVVWPAWHLGQMALGVIGQLQGVRYGLHAAMLLLFTVFFLALAVLGLRRERGGRE